MDATGFDAPEARDLLGAFLFSGEDVFKKVRSLSGGERNRLSLAEIVVSGANLLCSTSLPTTSTSLPARPWKMHSSSTGARCSSSPTTATSSASWRPGS